MNHNFLGLYKKARAGIIKGFTGIDQPYEQPEHPDVVCKTMHRSVKECVDQIVKMLEENCILPQPSNQVVSISLYFILKYKKLAHISQFFVKADDLMVPAEKLAEAKAEAERLPSLEIEELELQWLQVLGEGWAAPLKGFMKEREFLQCQHFNCLLDDKSTNQSIPIVLPLKAGNNTLSFIN